MFFFSLYLDKFKIILPQEWHRFYSVFIVVIVCLTRKLKISYTIYTVQNFIDHTFTTISKIHFHIVFFSFTYKCWTVISVQLKNSYLCVNLLSTFAVYLRFLWTSIILLVNQN